MKFTVKIPRRFTIYVENVDKCSADKGFSGVDVNNYIVKSR